jgi:hypothetical protein
MWYVSQSKRASAATISSTANCRMLSQASAYVSIRQHTSAYVCICQHTPLYPREQTAEWYVKQHLRGKLRMPPRLPSAYVRIRQDTSGYVRIRQQASAAPARRASGAPRPYRGRYIKLYCCFTAAALLLLYSKYQASAAPVRPPSGAPAPAVTLNGAAVTFSEPPSGSWASERAARAPAAASPYVSIRIQAYASIRRHA